MANKLVTAVTTESFREEVINHDGPVLVDFWADWCGPCHMLAPVVDVIAEQTEGKLKVVKVDTEANPELSQGLQIRSLPTLMLVTNDKNAEGRRRTVITVGVQPEGRLINWMKDEGVEL